jgi:putative hemolysin
MMLLTGRLPKEGDAVTWDGWRFEIVDMDGKKIDKVLACRREEQAPVGP